jgi:hypothetical protein
MGEGYWGEPFARKYMELEGKSAGYRIAAGLKEGWRHMPLTSKHGAMLVGHPWRRSVVGFNFGAALYCDRGLAEHWMRTEDSKEIENHLCSIVSYFEDKVTHSVFARSITEEEKKASGMRVFWAGGWGGHTLLDYDLVLTQGISGIRNMIQEYQRTCQDDASIFEWYESLLLVCDAICIMAERFADLASEHAQKVHGFEERERLAVLKMLLKIGRL